MKHPRATLLVLTLFSLVSLGTSPSPIQAASYFTGRFLWATQGRVTLIN